MDYEEKYNEALSRAKAWHVNTALPQETKGMLEKIFPELKESEDEDIRKAIIEHFKNEESKLNLRTFGGYFYKDIFAWLEKQKPIDKVEPKFKVGDIVRSKTGDGLEWEVQEINSNGYATLVCADRDDYIFLGDNWELVEQKPAEWSEEDEKLFNCTLINLTELKDRFGEGYGKVGKCIDWLKSLRPQKQQEWNKHDIDMIDWLIRCCEKEHKELCNDKYGHQDIVSDLKRDCRKKWDWLESLKEKVAPQKQWKPSKGQLDTLRNAASALNWETLEFLYEQLKNL